MRDPTKMEQGFSTRIVTRHVRADGTSQSEGRMNLVATSDRQMRRTKAKVQAIRESRLHSLTALIRQDLISCGILPILPPLKGR
ncbi:MAG: hypothetical protein LZF62_140132 [Nitrospira sp.]|nr:MAG: hypothetical protein LZF62_140132 [Nitrospira sp.]